MSPFVAFVLANAVKNTMLPRSDVRDVHCVASAIDGYTLPKIYRKVFYSISAAIHSKIVRVRETQARRNRDPPPRRPFGDGPPKRDGPGGARPDGPGKDGGRPPRPGAPGTTSAPAPGAIVGA